MAGQLARARAGDRAAFSALYERTLTPVYRYVSARVDTVSEAEEITQEVFLSALAGVRGLRAEDELGLLAWLYQIARHKLADHLRRRYRRPVAPLEDADDAPDPGPRPDEALLAADDRATLVTAMSALTPEQREVLVSKYVLEYDNEAVGRMIGKSANAVNQLHHRALGSLRRILARGDNESQRLRP